MVLAIRSSLTTQNSKKDKYQVRIFRDIICYEKLTVVTGAQDESQLHWGGHIPLPEGEEIDTTSSGA
jgi:hypothetical protein